MLIWMKMPHAGGWDLPEVIGALARFTGEMGVGLLVGALCLVGRFTLVESLGLACLVTIVAVLGRLLVESIMERRSRAHEQLDHDEARIETALRSFWQSSADFEGNAWARTDLESLSFLCANLDSSQPLSERLSSRLRTAGSAVLGGVLDRAADVVVSAGDSGLSQEQVGAIDSLNTELASALEKASFHAGELPREAWTESGRLAHELGERIAEMRDQVRPRVVADLPPILRWLLSSEFAPKLEAGAIELDLDEETGAGKVAVRPFDFVNGITKLLKLVFRRGQVGGTLCIEGRSEEEHYLLHLHWPVKDRWRLEPAALFEAIRPLSYYDARLAVEEDLESGRLNIEAWFPQIRRDGGAAPLADEVRPAGL